MATGDAASGSDEGLVERPVPAVLDDSAVVPAANLIEPAPNRFTHRLVADTPYWYHAIASNHPDGVLIEGTDVLLAREEVAAGGEAQCRVVDGGGLYVAIRGGGLQPLPR